jgi:translation initiation factor 1 (eIF-1/SUI1)
MTDQDIINLRSADPFADVTGFNQTESGAAGGPNAQRSSTIIHIRIQQRSGKKTLTTVQVSLFLLSFISHFLFKGYW